LIQYVYYDYDYVVINAND